MTETSGSRLKFVLCGTDAGDFGTIGGAGSAALAGRLEVSLCDGYRPVEGNTFEVMKLGAITGQFDDYSFQDGLQFEVHQTSTTLTLRVTSVPEPAGMLVWMMGSMILGRRRRRR